MLELVAVRTDSPEAQQLLSEYVTERARSRPASAGPYQPPAPDPRQFTEAAGRFLLAYDGAAALGCAGVRRIEPGREWVDDGFGGSCWFEIKHLYTRPEARGRGVARALLSGLAESAVRLGADRLVLDTHSTLEPAARLYEAYGFRRLPPFNGNQNADNWYGMAV